MPKRLLNMSASDFAATSPMDLKQAILASEGRTIMAENVPSSQFLGGVTNAEIERAAGADLLLFNALDVFDPVIAGIPDDLNENPVTWVKRACGRPIGVNLEPVDNEAEMSESRTEIPMGRRVSPKTLEKANELGFDFIGTTMVGYTEQSKGDKIEANDFEILRKIVAKAKHRVIAEGNINTPEKAKHVIELGAYSVVVGSIITRPQLITKSFVEEMER